ncbi:hypothetical protein DFQ28_008362 [Apophysomyces sp. BC1034]|nr:hypothetical protein DFQ30_009799 [Apophysomyces sp. BC1015]KAG0175411.1 hypothetical protein DFQ29_007151 [Apophysomyces sp. BC1021]KAG0186063.1 hypothetical protein DFQ28_008362 [Apophysomyces sp. BC1034]
MSPQPHGLPHDFAFDERQLEGWKTNQILADIRVDKWGDFDIVCSSINQHFPDAEASKAIRLLKHALRSINKNTTSMPMQLYTDRFITFLDKKPTKDRFLSAFSRVMDKMAIQGAVDHAKAKNELKADLVGTLLVGNALNKQAQNAMGGNTISSSSASMSTNANHPPSDDNDANDVIRKGTIEVISNANTGHSPEDDNDDVDECAGNMTTKSTIEKAAIEIYEQYTQGSPISSAERSIMSSGLSGILDFVDANEDGQRLLFGAPQWMKMRAQYEHAFKEILTFARPSHLDEALTHIIHLCERSKEAAARAYLTKAMEANDVDEDSMMGLRLVLQLFDSLTIHHTMLDPLRRIQPTEYDVAFKLWLPLFDRLFAGTCISTRIAETSNTFTAINKRAMYSNDHHHPVAFKIDIRFVHNCHHTSKMIDVAAAEAALDGSANDKTINDNAKLLREGKDILDKLLNTSLEQHAANAMMGVVIQLDGFQGEVSSIHLDQDGLYVALPRQRLQYPRSAASLRRFSDTMDALLALKDQLCSISATISNQMDLYKDKRASLGSKHARPATAISPHHLTKRQRATWYSPPRNDPSLSCLPPLSLPSKED